MRYITFIYVDEKLNPAPGSPGMEKLMADYFAYSDEVTRRGAFKSGDGARARRQDADDGRTVR